MKTKRTFYLVLIVVGVVIASLGENYMQEEYALSIGFALMMLGLYKTTQLWSNDKFEDKEKEDY